MILRDDSLPDAGLLVLNTPILGAVVKSTDMGITLEDIQDVIKRHFSGAPGERNAEAAKKTHEITKLS